MAGGERYHGVRPRTRALRGTEDLEAHHTDPEKDEDQGSENRGPDGSPAHGSAQPPELREPSTPSCSPALHPR